jgi:hypothetical protein
MSAQRNRGAMTCPATFAAYGIIEALQEASRAAAIRKYEDGPGAAAVGLDHLDEEHTLRKKRKKVVSAYVSRFAAQEYDKLLPHAVAESTAALAAVDRRRDRLENENAVIRAEIARIQALRDVASLREQQRPVSHVAALAAGPIATEVGRVEGGGDGGGDGEDDDSRHFKAEDEGGGSRLVKAEDGAPLALDDRRQAAAVPKQEPVDVPCPGLVICARDGKEVVGANAPLTPTSIMTAGTSYFEPYLQDDDDDVASEELCGDYALGSGIADRLDDGSVVSDDPVVHLKPGMSFEMLAPLLDVLWASSTAPVDGTLLAQHAPTA